MGSYSPLKRSFIYTFDDGGREAAKSLDESSIKRCQAIKTPNFGDGGGSLP